MDGHDLPDPLLRHQAMNQEQRRETEDRQEPRNQAAEGEVTLGRSEGGRDPAEEERVRVVTVGNYFTLGLISADKLLGKCIEVAAYPFEVERECTHLWKQVWMVIQSFLSLPLFSHFSHVEGKL